MHFYSTNKKSPSVDFEHALFKGLAPDGGLYYPDRIPQFSRGEISSLKGATLAEVGTAVLEKWLGDDLTHDEIESVVQDALTFPIPLKKVGDVYILELFHGPTLAFKDIAARTLARLMEVFVKKNNKKIVVLTATSGDTGGAVAQGFADCKDINVVILYPKGKVSRLQEEQLTRVADNVVSIEVDGVFDDCQSLAKQAFSDPDLVGLNLTSANSINIGRLIPQIIFYAYSYAQMPQDNLAFIVPSGNFGNLTAGLFARAMGFPFGKFLVANNANDPVVRYVQTGVYKTQNAVATLSNAMDIGAPSNFERIQELMGHDHAVFTRLVDATSVSDVQTTATIKSVYEKYDYLLDPHTAVAWSAWESWQLSDKYIPIIHATASPIKFADVIKKHTGIEVDDSGVIDNLQKKKSKKISVGSSYEEIKSSILSSLL